MTAVYLLRHPETTWNDAKRYQGRLESPLSTQGQLQARRLAVAFANQKLAAVYCSPLRRALDLGYEIAQQVDTPVCVDERLTEIAQCPWEGLHLAEIETRYLEMFEEWYSRPDRVHFPGGENLASVQVRALSVLDDVYARHPTDHVAVVTHSVVIQVVVASILSLDLRYVHNVRVSNAGITTLCGTALPGSVLTLNNTDPLFHSPVAGAAAQDCASWQPRRVTQ